MKLLLSGLDTVECAYYLRETLGCKFDFADLAAKREAMRAAKRREPFVVAIGGKEFLLGRGGTASGYPLMLTKETLIYPGCPRWRRDSRPETILA